MEWDSFSFKTISQRFLFRILIFSENIPREEFRELCRSWANIQMPPPIYAPGHKKSMSWAQRYLVNTHQPIAQPYPSINRKITRLPFSENMEVGSEIRWYVLVVQGEQSGRDPQHSQVLVLSSLDSTKFVLQPIGQTSIKEHGRIVHRSGLKKFKILIKTKYFLV